LEGCLPLVASCDVNIVVASAEVELSVDLCTAKLIKEGGDKWDQVPILLSDLVEVSEVNAELQGTIFLWKRGQVHLLATVTIR